MLKTLCDRCGKEIPRKSLSGIIARKVELLPVIPIPGGGPRGGKGLMVRREVHEEALDLCKDCMDEVWELAKIKKEEEVFKI